MVAMGLLARLGFDPEVVSNGQQAVDAVTRTDYVTVLMDCNMPVMDGFEATAAIRRLEQEASAASGRPARHVPIVAMTAGALVGDRERCLAAGMDDYVSKPVNADDLDSVLARWSPSDAPVAAPGDAVDADQLASLRALDGGNGVFLATLVESFEVSSVASLRVLAAAVEAGDADALSREAHRFKGEAATLGAGGVAELCGNLEHMQAPLDRVAARALVARAEREVPRVLEGLRVALGTAQVS